MQPETLPGAHLEENLRAAEFSFTQQEWNEFESVLSNIPIMLWATAFLHQSKNKWKSNNIMLMQFQTNYFNEFFFAAVDVGPGFKRHFTNALI
ncbi:MAG TPA: hypothetical protein VIJ92_01985 [Ginsengibacter sp.]